MILPIIEERKIMPEVILLGGPGSIVWIDKASHDCLGAIPASGIIMGEKRRHHNTFFPYFCFLRKQQQIT